MLHLVSSVRVEAFERENDVYDRVFDHYRRFIELAVEAGEISGDVDEDMLAETIRDVWQGNLHRWAFQSRPKPLESAMNKKLDFLFGLFEGGQSRG